MYQGVVLEAIALILTKFSDEVIAAQLALLCFVSCVALYWLVVRKKKKESAEWVPAALVRAYLDKVRTDEQEVRFKLFGEAPMVSTGHAPLATALSTVTTITDPALLKEVDALRHQLASSDQRAMEFDRVMNALKAEKAALEEKLKAAAAGAPVAAGAPSPAALKELEDLKARLQEYEVIEDDLANLKKFQKENEQLRQKVETYEKGGTTIPAAASAPMATTVVSGGDKPAAPTMTLVSGGNASVTPEATTIAAAPAPTPEPVAAPAPVAAAAPAAPETNTNVLQAVAPSADAPAAAAAPAAPAAEAAPEKSAKQKEEELLSEFEKMLAS